MPLRNCGWPGSNRTKRRSSYSLQSSSATAIRTLGSRTRINGVMTRKATFKSLEWPELTVQVVGNNAVVRHLWGSESELDGKVTNTKIGVMQIWQKQDGGWKLLARASWRLPPPA